MSQISAFALLFLIFLTVMGLVGRQQLAHRLRFSPVDGYPVSLNAKGVPFTSPRTNFDSLGESMLAVFRLASGERWFKTMFDANRAVGSMHDYTSGQSGGGGVMVCITTVVVGQFIVLNIFVAMLINSFKTVEGSMRGARYIH
jgi:hypothetical protein